MNLRIRARRLFQEIPHTGDVLKLWITARSVGFLPGLAATDYGSAGGEASDLAHQKELL
jgi:hypothetical protein